MLIGYRPDDEAYITSSGADFHPQDEFGNGNIPFYEILNPSDEIQFRVDDHLGGLDNPVMTLNTHWGPTDFDLIDQIDSDTIISEQSGFDNDLWVVDVSGASGLFTLTNFDTGSGVTGTTAAWLPFVGLIDAEV